MALKIITLTSWKSRLANLMQVITSILEQTIKADKIVLNLSSEEFPLKEYEIPNELLQFLMKNGVEIYWVDGKNTKQWKKILPTLFRYPNDWIICIDDDRIYDRNFIEKLWLKHLKYPDNPITLNRGYRVNGYLQHCGHGTLVCMNFYKNFSGIDINEVIEYTDSSDTFFNFILARNGYRLIPIDGDDESTVFNEIKPLSKSNNTKNEQYHLKTWKWLSKKYPFKTLDKDENKKIVSSMYSFDEHQKKLFRNKFKRNVVRIKLTR